MPEVTCLVMSSVLSASTPKVTEMVACLTFMIHIPDESLLTFGHPCDCYVRYDLSHSSRDFHLTLDLSLVGKYFVNILFL